jgi:membrane associated rhomboid family serine protease
MRRTFTEEIKHQFNYGGIHIQLLMINLFFFLVINLCLLIDKLFLTGGVFQHFIELVIVLPPTFEGLLFRPWSLFTYMFSHMDFFHILGNMLFLYFGGELFRNLLGERRLLYTYLVGGIVGGLIQIGANELIPFFMLRSTGGMIGASASVMAVFIAVSFYRPNAQVLLFGMFPVRLIVLALIFIAMDFLNLTSGDNVGHLAHLGGALVGYLSVKNVHSASNFMFKIEVWGDRKWMQISKLFKRQPKMRAYKTHKKATNYGRPKTDEQFLSEKKERQEKIDAILDKISKKGYDSLSKDEKQFLFSQKED